MTKNKKRVLTGIIIIFAALVIGGGIYYIQQALCKCDLDGAQSIAPDQIPNVPLLPGDTNGNVKSASSSMMAGWKTYIDDSEHYTLQYPPDFDVYATDDLPAGHQNTIFSYDDNGNRFFSIKTEHSSTSLESFVRAYVAQSKKDSADAAASVSVTSAPKKVGSLQGYLILSQAGDVLGNTDAVFVIKNGDQIVSFSYSYQGATFASNKAYAEIQKIIGSFLLTSQDPLVTFSSKDLGISFKYDPRLVMVNQAGTKLYVERADDDSNNPLSGNSIEVFKKPADEAIIDTVKRVFLKDYPSSYCVISDDTAQYANNPKSFGKYKIISIQDTDPNVTGPYPSNKNCNDAYVAINEPGHFFMYDPTHPTTFFFYDGGAAVSSDWMDTIIITN